jgi:hypothetical protein
VRILIVVILAWVAEALFGIDSLLTLTLAFFAGIVPETVLVAVREFLQARLTSRLPKMRDQHPLTLLEEIDLYDRARLFEEGVTNIESLAHHDLVDLILATRIPVARLVDWVDQAILYLHLIGADGQMILLEKGVSPTVGNDHSTEPATGAKASSKSLALRQILRSYGIRTATDLQVAYEIAIGKSLANTTMAEDQLSGLLTILDETNKSSAGPNGLRMHTLYAMLQNDEWLPYIRHWRESAMVRDFHVTFDNKGQISFQENHSATEVTIP